MQRTEQSEWHFLRSTSQKQRFYATGRETMEQVMPDFITYLTNERNASKSTVSSYCRDLERMFQFLDGKGIKKTDDVTPISLNSYILYLEKEGFSISTVSRNVASMKAYFHYAFGHGFWSSRHETQPKASVTKRCWSFYMQPECGCRS